MMIRCTDVLYFYVCSGSGTIVRLAKTSDIDVLTKFITNMAYHDSLLPATPAL